MNIQVKSINVGMPKEVPFLNKVIQTGINKTPINGGVFVSLHNIEGDGQADLTVHGGIDKAVCVYSFDHYPYWEKRLGRTLKAGAFGENLTIAGLIEENVMIGDIYRIGEAVFQVSLPRQPCYKLSVKWDEPSLPLWIKETGYSGFYFRVLEAGMIEAGQSLNLIERHQDGISVAFANYIKYQDQKNKEALQKLVQLDVLASSWKNSFSKRLREIERS